MARRTELLDALAEELTRGYGVAVEVMAADLSRLEDVELEHEFLRVGRRTLMVNARKLHRESGQESILLAFEDRTAARETARMLPTSMSFRCSVSPVALLMARMRAKSRIGMSSRYHFFRRAGTRGSTSSRS